MLNHCQANQRKKSRWQHTSRWCVSLYRSAFRRSRIWGRFWQINFFWFRKRYGIHETVLYGVAASRIGIWFLASMEGVFRTLNFGWNYLVVTFWLLLRWSASDTCWNQLHEHCCTLFIREFYIFNCSSTTMHLLVRVPSWLVDVVSICQSLLTLMWDWSSCACLHSSMTLWL